MTREEALRILREHRQELDEFHVASLSIFGSVARNEAEPGSDVDVLVEFSRPVGYFTFQRLQRHLEELLRRRVDLATPQSIRPIMRDAVMREAVRAT